MPHKQPTYEGLYELAEQIAHSESYRQLFLESLILSPYENNGSAYEIKRLYQETFGIFPDRESFRLICSMLHQGLLHYFEAHRNELSDAQAEAVAKFALRLSANAEIYR